MSQEYEHCWHSLNAVQVETSEAVAALEGNMADMKSAMQGLIGEAEVKLGELQSWQEELAGKQDKFHTGVQEELHIKTALEAPLGHTICLLPLCRSHHLP